MSKFAQMSMRPWRGLNWRALIMSTPFFVGVADPTTDETAARAAIGRAMSDENFMASEGWMQRAWGGKEGREKPEYREERERDGEREGLVRAAPVIYTGRPRKFRSGVRSLEARL